MRKIPVRILRYLQGGTRPRQGVSAACSVACLEWHGGIKPRLMKSLLQKRIRNDVTVVEIT